MFSGYVKDIESKPSPTPWGSKMPFANMLAEFSNSVHVSFNVMNLLKNDFYFRFSNFFLKFHIFLLLLVRRLGTFR